MKALIPALLLLLGGCAINIPPLDVEHTTTYYSTRAELVEAYGRPIRLGYLINGFTRYRSGGLCGVHLLVRDAALMACTLRHEQRHCIDVGWHDSKPNNDCDTNGRGLSINGDWSY